MANWVNISTIDNNTPFYDVAWKVGVGSGDRWFAEASGLTTDNKSWMAGTGEANGYYTYHRFNANQYTCTFIPEGRISYGQKIEYGISVEDEPRSNLPTQTINGDNCYVLGIQNWSGWTALYAPYSSMTKYSSYTIYVDLDNHSTPTLTGITIENLSINSDVPASGGTVSSADCTFNVIAAYSDSSTGDVTTSATVSGSLVVPSSTATTRHQAGTLTLTATYDSQSATSSVTVYQEAFVDNWLSISPVSGHGNGTITVTASTLYSLIERVAQITASNSQYSLSDSVTITQKGYPTAITFNNVVWTTDVPATGGTATKDNCTYEVIATYSDGTQSDISSSSTISGSLVVSATSSYTRDSVGVLNLTATYGEFTATTAITAYQAAPSVTGISFTSLSWVVDVPASGGTADKDNCLYTIMSYYEAGLSKDITNDATVSGSLNVSATTATTRESVGTLTLTASYSGFTTTGSVTAYQEAYADYLRFNVISGGTIGIIDRYYGEGYSNVHITYEYKLNGGEWLTASATSLPSINVREGDVVLLRNHRWLYPALNYNGGYMQVITSSGAVIDVEGNILSLLDGDNFESITDLENFRGNYFVFKYFFEGSDVRSAKDLKLKATKLPNAAYRYMFANCTNLIDTPIFAEDIDVNDYCYANMFEGCVSLTKAPVCITSIISGSANYYCASMFEGCVSLEIPPAMQHTISSSVGEYGYKALTNMFSGCTSLLVSPDIPVPFGDAGDLGFYDGLFGRCSNLEYIRCLHYSPREEYLDTRDWVVGVANNGVFVKSSSVPDSAWTPHNAHACPSGWVMEDYDGNDLALVKLVYEDIPYTGGTAQIDVSKCRTFLVKNDSVTEVTSSSTISSTTLTVSATTATTRQKVGTVSVTAQYSGYTTTRTVDIYQTPIQEEPMFIYFKNTTWVRNVPPEGGVATSANCSFSINLYYNTGRQEDVTNSAIVTGSLIVSATTACTQEQVGSFTLTATYSGYTASTTSYVYQEGDCLTFEILPYQPYDEETEEGIWDTNIYWNGYGGRGIQYNINNTKNGWTNLGVRGRIENVQPGDIIRFRGTQTRYGGNEKFLCTYFETEVPFNVRGNIGSLIDYNNVSGITSATSYMFTYLFNNCNVVDASGLVLPWSVADEGAYGNMFEGCTGLTKSPYIMVETVGSNALKEMFKGCNNLSEIVCMATNAGTGYSDGWTNGVSATGTFVKNPNMSSWTTGDSGIPSGWTVVDAT